MGFTTSSRVTTASKWASSPAELRWPSAWAARDEVPPHRMTPLFGTLWNFANGLESAVLVALYAAVVWCYVRRPASTARGALAFGLLLGALSLARLDHAVFALAIAGLPFARHALARDARRARLGAWTLLGWGVVLAL